MRNSNALKYDYYNTTYENTYTYRPTTKPVSPKIKHYKKNKKKTMLASIVTLTLLTGLGFGICPFSIKNMKSTYIPTTIPTTTSDNVIISNTFEPSTTVNYNEFIYPTLSYLDNYSFLNTKINYVTNSKKAQMVKLEPGDRLTALENSLKILNSRYSMVKPSIYVYSLDNHNYAAIDSNKVYPAASIIKLPVLIQLYKTIETGMINNHETMQLTEYYRSSGSGDLQYARGGNTYSIFNLAKTMIQDSDNTSTNMLMSKIGSMNDINAAMLNWGIKNTHLQTWLPDLTGNNYTTAEDLAQMLLNIDNDDFLSEQSQLEITEIMGNVKNSALIKAGLPKDISFKHKTGDIGTMLGDAGIVYLPSGQRYIVVILATRPHNNVNGKLFIQEASKIIYNYMSTMN